MTTALYLRQSLHRDHDEQAIDRQRKDLEALCAARGWTDAKVYSDNDHSASVRMPRSTKVAPWWWRQVPPKCWCVDV